MATDHKSSNVLSELADSSPIENELPTYRAISSRAVLSVLCGILSLFSIANSFFFIFAVLAVVLGFTADWNIQRYPDILTGRRLAQTGVALGLIFGLGIFTVSSVQGFIRARNAESFAKHYAEVFKNGNSGRSHVARNSSSPAQVDLARGSDGEDAVGEEERSRDVRDEDRPAPHSQEAAGFFKRP